MGATLRQGVQHPTAGSNQDNWGTALPVTLGMGCTLDWPDTDGAGPIKTVEELPPTQLPRTAFVWESGDCPFSEVWLGALCLYG